MRTDVMRMANLIARQFEHLPPDQASAAVVDHLATFWPPAMRWELLACVGDDPSSLHPAVVGAANGLHQRTVLPAR